MALFSAVNPLVTSFGEADIPWQAGRGIYKLWNEKRGSRKFPARADVSPLEMKDWLPGVALIDVVGDPLRFRGRLAGTQLSNIRGFDPTPGKYMDEYPDSDALIKRYTWLVENRKPYFCADIPMRFANKNFQSYSIIAMPLGETDERVDMLLFHLEFGRS